jgi:hypothetical protein
MNSLNEALKQFEATEANLVKLEALWGEITAIIPGGPDGIAFGDLSEGIYDDRCRAFRDICDSLPKIDGWELTECLLELNEIAQMRFDVMEMGMGDIGHKITVEETIYGQEKYLQEYRYKLNKKRRQLIRGKLLETINQVDSLVRKLSVKYPNDYQKTDEVVKGEDWENLKKSISVIDTLLGSSVKRTSKWFDIRRHMKFELVCDFLDIKGSDWPSIKSRITKGLYGKSDPIPVQVKDIGTLVDSKPSGEVITKLKWDLLSDDEFERLIFSLIAESNGYENSEWLTKTNATDRGRDLSVTRVFNDSLGGVLRQRVIIQCKHQLSKSINLDVVSTLKEQMKLWEPPRVDVHVIATSGRFTTDAIQYIEKNNQSDTGLRVEMWPESHIERLLASRPALVGEFGLR